MRSIGGLGGARVLAGGMYLGGDGGTSAGGLKTRGMGTLKGSLDRPADGRVERTGEVKAKGGDPGSSIGGEERIRRLGPAVGGSSAAVDDDDAVPPAEATADGGLKAPKALAGADVTRLKGVLNELCVGTRCGPRPAAAEARDRKVWSTERSAEAISA